MLKVFRILITGLIVTPSFLSFVSCHNSNENINQKNSTDSLKRSNQYIDSLKWLFYSINIDNERIRCFDSAYKSEEKINLFEIEFNIIINTEKDGSKIFCAEPFFENKLTSCNMDGMESFDRIVTNKNKIHLIPTGCLIKWDHPELIPWKNQDSIPKYISLKETKLKEILRNYKGHINPWLYKEAVRRGVL